MNWIRATYLVTSTDDEIQARADALALEQSVEMPLGAVRDPRIREEVVARVDGIEPVPGRRFRVSLLLSPATTGNEVTQLLNMLLGNCSLQDDLALEDVVFPPEMTALFGGPRGGIGGLRALLGAHGRPLTSTALKPQGSSSKVLASLCRTFALAGIDVIKDDHGLADQVSAPFEERVRECQAAIAEADGATGKTTLYAPSLVGSPRSLHRRAQFAADLGVKILLVAPMLVGIPAFRELVEAFPKMLILAHPAFSGSVRISPVWLFGRFFRLLGADAVIYPNFGGRFAYSAERCRDLAAAARSPWDGVLPSMPVPAGGMTVERVEELIAFYGDDVMLLIGGGLLSAGDRLLERSRAFVAKATGR